MGALGVLYPVFREIPRVDAVFAGVNAAVLAIVAAAALQIGRRMTKTIDFLIAGAVAGAVSLGLVTVLEAVVLVAFGALVVSRYGSNRVRATPLAGIIAFPMTKTLVLIPSLVLVFLQIGISLFGGGLAMIPMLDHQVVAHGWLTRQEFQDTVTLSRLTPGPIATACTFVGYRMAGLWGAVIATVAVFSPPFLLSVAAARSATRLERSSLLRAVLGALGPASVGLIAAAAVSLGRVELHDLRAWVFALGSLFLVLVLEAPPVLVFALAGGLNLLLSFWAR
jgi:chromate transporter